MSAGIDSVQDPGRVEGTLFAAGSSAGQPASLVLCDGRLFLELPERAPLPIAGQVLGISAAVCGVPRRIELADGRVFIAPQTPALSEMLRRGEGVRDRGRLIARLEKPGFRRFAVLVLVFLVLVVSLRWSLPVVTDAVGAVVPRSVESLIGQTAFRQIDGDGPASLLNPTALPQDTRAALQERFAVLAQRAGLSNDLVLEFRSTPSMGPNAFAFPGGPVVLTDQLVVFALDTDPEHGIDALTGILGHEITHVSERHGLRRLFRIGGLSITLAVLIGDMGSLVDQASVLVSLVLDRGYSRDFEREADRGAVVLLGAAGYDTEPLRRLTAALREVRGAGGGWMSTHPGFEERDTILSGKGFSGPRLSFE